MANPNPMSKPNPKRRSGTARQTQVSPGRRIAAGLLRQMEAGRRLDRSWEESEAPGSPERGWIRTLAYGVARLRGRIDFILEAAGGRSLSTLDPEVQLALRMGAFQLLAMDGVPAYAAVSESVEQLRGTRSRAAAGLVNAVLRKVAARPWSEDDFPDPERDPEGFLASWGSHPRWLARRWIDAFGFSAARRLIEANNLEPVVYLRPLAMGATEAAAELAAAGFTLRGPPLHGAIPLGPGTDPAAALALFPGVVQDPAAALVADFIAPPPGSLVADLCAAPGGKALALAATGARVLAADRSRIRLQRLSQSSERMRSFSFAPVPWVVAADAAHPPLARAETLLLDVPCSGTGTLRRHPDGRWRLSADRIAELAAVQTSILEGAATAVPPGGLLVYATCALEPEENRMRIDDFLHRHPDFAIETGPAPKRFQDNRGCLEILPQESGCDGAFAARLRRRPG